MENVPVTEFAAAILAANAGMVNREASTKLAELVEAVMRTRKGGQVSVTIKVEPGKDSERMVKLHCSTDAKIPADKFPPSLWFIDPDENDGKLYRNDPIQKSLFGDDERVERHDPRTGNDPRAGVTNVETKKEIGVQFSGQQ